MSVNPPEWVNMSVERAVYILEDVSPGQLDNFALRTFRWSPEPVLKLICAVQTVRAARFSGLVELNPNGRWAYEMIVAKQAELETSRPDIKSYIDSALRGEMTDDDGELFGAPDDFWVPKPSADTVRIYNLVNGTNRPGYVYVLRSPTGAYKIGYAENPANRLRTFSVKLPFEVEYELLIKTDDMRSLEAKLHERYAHRHINGEWFALTADDLAELRAMGGAQ